MSKNEKTVRIINQHGPQGFILFLAYLGAVVYFIEQSSGFFGFIWALLKAIVWPAIVVYNVFELFGV